MAGPPGIAEFPDDRYRLIRELGRGGMAVVYLADDLRHARQVAIKVLRPELAASVGHERFLREITLAGSLQHPHILPVYDSGTRRAPSGELLYYVMPFVEGESLRQRLAREGQLPVDEAIVIAREVLDALAAAHARGIVHRDIKPENILLSGGHALVADFGIARAIGAAAGERLTETGLAIGTPVYMSPEQAAAEREVDARSDLYSLGCVLYEMLAGEPPFTGPTVQSILVKQVTNTPPSVRWLRQTVPAEVDAALSRVLARAPADRFPTASAFRAALQPGNSSGAAPVPFARPWRSRLPLFTALLLLGAAAGALVWARRRPSAGEPRWRLALTDLTVANRDSSTDYLGGGIPEYLVTALRRLPGLEVIPMSLVRRDSAVASPVDLGHKLGATVVLTGTLTRFGGKLGINPELVQVSDGRLLWSAQFEYPDTDYAGIIPAVVAVIADSLRLELSGGARRQAIASAIVDPVVLDLLLRGEHLWSRGASGAPGDSATIDSSRVLFERVLARDPGNLQATWGIGAYYRISFIRGWSVPGLTPGQAQARGDSLNRVTLAIDSTYPLALGLLTIDQTYLQDDFPGALHSVDLALRGDPGYANGYRMRAILQHEILGDLRGALPDYQHAADLDASPLELNSLANGLMMARRYEEAATVLERSMAIRPSAGAWTRLITSYERLGRHADATRIRRQVDPTGASAAPFEAAMTAHDTVAYARARRAELQRSADSLIARLDRADVVPAERYNVAELRIDAILCELEESKKAMDLVEDLYRIRPKRLRWIVTNVDLGCLRQDPRYLPMVKAAGLEPYLRN